MEVDPCIERLGKTSIAGNRESNSYDYADLFIEHWSVSTKWSDENMHKTLLTCDRQFSKLFSGKPRTEENQDGVSHELFLK
jgi:hypothetical protein